MRLISCVSLACVFGRPALNLENSPMTDECGMNEDAERWNQLSCAEAAPFVHSRISFGGLEFFDVLVRQLDGADERFAFAHAVAIRAAGDEQIVLVGDVADNAAAVGGGMLGVKTFDAVQPGRHQIGDDFVGAVQSRMRHDGETAGLVDQFDRFERGHLGLGHPGGAAFFKKPLEGFVQVPQSRP